MAQFRIELGYLGSKRLNYSSSKTLLIIDSDSISFPPPSDYSNQSGQSNGLIKIPIEYFKSVHLFSCTNEIYKGNLKHMVYIMLSTHGAPQSKYLLFHTMVCNQFS